jgi:antitoxin (DNA-binding transcriptional repressor) of toxin-antitoxin stability system
MSLKIDIDEINKSPVMYLNLVERGLVVIVTRNGKPIVCLEPIHLQSNAVKPGFASELLADWVDVNWKSLDQEARRLFKEP